MLELRLMQGGPRLEPRARGGPKVYYITIGQRAGFSLEEIAAQLATLPDRFPLLKKDWTPMSRVWDERIDQPSPNSSG